MPRNRTVRLAVLGSAAQRSQTASYSSRTRSPLRRRLVLGVLVLLSVVMITVYFRESDGGALHDVQGAGATVLRPFEVGAERVARPFRDAYGWFSDLTHARSDARKLRAENDRLRNQIIQDTLALRENRSLRALLHYRDSARFPHDFNGIAARILTEAPLQFQRQVVISAGSSDGVRLYSPVVTEDGLVGQVTEVAPDGARVTLLTAPTGSVSALDLQTSAAGLIRHGLGRGEQLIFDRVTKDQAVEQGDVVVTAGSVQGKLPSMYPRGIQIGTVTSVSQNDIDNFKQIQVQPFVDFSSLDAVLVLVSQRPQPRLP